MVSLFAGIGGFDIAAESLGIETEVFVEKDKFCKKVLAQNFPGIQIVDDIFDFNVEEYEKITGKRTTDIICGGFPCQPFSLAGQRKGKEDDRHLWPQMFRVIQELTPRWVIAENVYGLVNIQGGLVFETVCTDLESEGYEVQTFNIPAVSKNAPHRRDRIWIVAHSNRNSEPISTNNVKEWLDVTNTNDRSKQKYRLPARRQMFKNRASRKRTSTYSNAIGCNYRSNNRQERHFQKKQVRDFEKNKPEWKRWKYRTSTNCETRNDSYTNCKRLQRSSKKRDFREERKKQKQQSPRLLWRNWLQFPTQSAVCRRNDGIPDRVDRIKALGNAIVPQVAYELFKSILAAEENAYSRKNIG
jgi:DNA (cytosine-5)-methyltransferase 1